MALLFGVCFFFYLLVTMDLLKRRNAPSFDKYSDVSPFLS